MPHLNLNISATPVPTLTASVERYAIHTICKSIGLRFRGLTPIGHGTGEFLSEAWHVTNGDPANLIGGWLYFHDSSNSRSTFAARILDAIPRNSDTGKLLVAFRVKRDKVGSVGWRGTKASQSVHNGGMILARLKHETNGQ
jgi:hypothetical protein